MDEEKSCHPDRSDRFVTWVRSYYRTGAGRLRMGQDAPLQLLSFHLYNIYAAGDS